jgi:hypothetical protein
MRQLLSCFALVLFMLSSCKKEIGENQKLDPKDQKKYDLMTNVRGSWWLYGGSDSTVTILTASGRDSTVKGLFFSYYERVDTTSALKDIMPEFFGKNTNRYITLMDLDGTYSRWVTIIFYKDGVPVGEKWTNTDKLDYLGLAFDIKTESSIVDTTGVMELNGRTYNKVIKIHHDFWGRVNIGFESDYTDVGYLDVWFVKGIGIIKKDLNIDLAGNFSKVYRDSLLNYHFQPE